MGRRKKEPESTHRENIASAAQRLFSQSGIAAATMDAIGREAGYSKATLYVYFKNKEEIVGYLALKSMKMLHECIVKETANSNKTKEKYDGICGALAQYQEQYPLYFSLALGEINVDLEREDVLDVEKETYEVGEQINRAMEDFIRQGIAAGDLRPGMPVLQTVFLFWASLAGVIQMAANKQKYIEMAMGLSKKQFLQAGFERLYGLIAAKKPAEEQE